MKKTIIAISILLTSVICFGQKPEEKQIKKDSVVVLTGNIQAFIILYDLLVNPDNISVNQKKMVVDWISKWLMIMPKELFEKKPKQK